MAKRKARNGPGPTNNKHVDQGSVLIWRQALVKSVAADATCTIEYLRAAQLQLNVKNYALHDGGYFLHCEVSTYSKFCKVTNRLTV
ncbi:unnamed protein product [Blumeria hordei]|uniref:Uncharacterized protein n=1 Tax=Blumeria hordei TaxID=2867405 RepID=A0A383UPZ5_BLUHO|nr:unnamed protein product [Blumeria hordei]